jgi:release factor glutamine methyltransferase
MNFESHQGINPGLAIREILQKSSLEFKTKGILTPRLDAELLLAFSLKLKRIDIHLQANRPLTEQESIDFSYLVKKRLEGTPVAYLIKQQEFWSLPLLVSSDVLIPRPETELLVEISSSRLKKKQQKKTSLRLRVADLGTGSGAILLALASQLKELDLYGMDISQKAISVASTNACTLQKMLLNRQHRLLLFQSTFMEDFFQKRSLDFLISNPPYIPTTIISRLSPEVQKEPRMALDGGPDGLSMYRRILISAVEVLVDQGEIFLEHGYDQRKQLLDLIQEHPEFQDVECFDDLEGRPRVIRMVKS